MFQKEIAFDVGLSNMPCGTNVAIYSEMEKTDNTNQPIRLVPQMDSALAASSG